MLKLSTVVLLVLAVSPSGTSKTSEPRQLESTAETRDCDYSRYEPLTISHPLLDAVVKRVEPVYPAMAKKAGIQGKVVVKVLINRRGEVVDACVTDGNPVLGIASKIAAKKWKFKKNFGFTYRPPQSYITASLAFTFSLDRNSRRVGAALLESPKPMERL